VTQENTVTDTSPTTPAADSQVSEHAPPDALAVAKQTLTERYDRITAELDRAVESKRRAQSNIARLRAELVDVRRALGGFEKRGSKK
jgi:hypothetical protein